jgi:hypothetical protein
MGSSFTALVGGGEGQQAQHVGGLGDAGQVGEEQAQFRLDRATMLLLRAGPARLLGRGDGAWRPGLFAQQPALRGLQAGCLAPGAAGREEPAGLGGEGRGDGGLHLGLQAWRRARGAAGQQEYGGL